jgi:hypothetical protein
LYLISLAKYTAVNTESVYQTGILKPSQNFTGGQPSTPLQFGDQPEEDPHEKYDGGIITLLNSGTIPVHV